MKAGALFAGYGGIELAVHEVLGAEPAWFSEFDKAPSKILAHHWPDVPNLGDVTKIDWAAVEPVDIITGGSPCQDLSHAGKRAGMRGGTRSGLWASMCDATDIIRPRLVVWENVRGALSATAAAGDVESCEFCMDADGEPPLRALGRVLGDLAELGYDAAWCGLRATDVGAPHGRFRIFVLAWPAQDADRAVGGERGNAAPGQAEGRGARANAGGRGGAPAADVALLPTPVVNDMGAGKTPDAWDAWDAWTERLKSSHGNGHGDSLSIEALRMLPTPQAHDAVDGKTAEQVAAMRARTGAGVWNLNEVAANELAVQLMPTPTTTQRGADVGGDTRVGAGPNLHNAVTDFGTYSPAITRWEQTLGRTAPSPTEPTGKAGAQRLSPAFVEWMMGLPDGHVTDVGITRNEQLKALGNGVVPQQCAAALRHLLAVRASVIGTGVAT